MYVSGEVTGWHLDQVESELRRRLDELDAEWRRKFTDLERRLRDTKSALDTLDRQAHRGITGDGMLDGMVMLAAWAPMVLVIISIMTAARR